jgi:hypothetical protein
MRRRVVILVDILSGFSICGALSAVFSTFFRCIAESSRSTSG